MEQTAANKSFGGRQLQYRHTSESLNCEMFFSIFLPPQSDTAPVPVLYWLSGLTCTELNFVTKAGAQQHAAQHGIAIVVPDTSPRGKGVADDPDRYDLGQGAGFYVNATQPPWSNNYHMYDYVNVELPALIERNFPVIAGLKSVSGHSMGGHGALISSLKNPGKFRSVSAFAPICNPVVCGWGQGCFAAYLGDDQGPWQAYDATELIRSGAESLPLFIDQGSEDDFLETQLYAHNLVSACRERDIQINLRMQPGYDHSYYFIASFIGEHIAYHAGKLRE
jgi:S-formylglutathione hydrolase